MKHARLARIAAVLVWLAPPMAWAQGSASVPPPSAAKEGGGTPEGDPSGAVRSLGSADESRQKSTVIVPDVGSVRDGERRGPPPDTAR